jgi:hypothetical protein
MNKAQKAFYEKNLKTIVNLKREGDVILATKLEKVNFFLKQNEISKALEWACGYNLPLEFILDMKDLFCGFIEE